MIVHVQVHISNLELGLELQTWLSKNWVDISTVFVLPTKFPFYWYCLLVDYISIHLVAQARSLRVIPGASFSKILHVPWTNPRPAPACSEVWPLPFLICSLLLFSLFPILCSIPPPQVCACYFTNYLPNRKHDRYFKNLFERKTDRQSEGCHPLIQFSSAYSDWG